jgi:EAL domain-containing protein (putative c-di-GMP-specific phosphodiesterase class I)
MGVDEESMGIVETIITLASKLKMNVIAEGIETKEQWEKLQALNCNYGQGFLFSKPVPAEAAYLLINDEHQKHSITQLAEELPRQEEVELLSDGYSM